MQSEKKVLTDVITPQLLSMLDKEQLIDILQYKTNDLVSARAKAFPDRIFIKNIQHEVKLIQDEILTRTG